MAFEIKNVPGSEAFEYAGKRLDLPQRSAKLATDGPAFIASASASTSLTSVVDTKVLFGNEQLDTAGCYDPVLSRFTPNVPGLYWFAAAVRVTATATSLVMYLYKNGAQHREMGVTAQGVNQNTTGGTLVQMNGTTDYVELYINQGAATQNTTNNGIVTWFSGHFVRGL